MEIPVYFKIQFRYITVKIPTRDISSAQISRMRLLFSIGEDRFLKLNECPAVSIR